MKEIELRQAIGRRIKRIRSEKGISQTVLAKGCNFERAAMSRIESGKVNPTLSTLFKISNFLKVEVADFFVH
jgi:transcriptional regulator with XRE-family HTH domain